LKVITAPASSSFFPTSPGADPLSEEGKKVTVPIGGTGEGELGYLQVGTLRVVVFEDSDGNDAKDDEEGLLTEEVTVSITFPDGSNTEATFTGELTIGDVPTGEYELKVITAPASSSFFPTSPGADPLSEEGKKVTVPIGGTGEGELGYLQVGTLRIVIFEDDDGDGSQGGGEGLLTEEVTVRITFPNGTAFDQTFTGELTLDGIPIGEYEVQVITAPASGSSIVTSGSILSGLVVEGGGLVDAPFGYIPQTGTGGTVIVEVYFDADRNDKYDPTEGDDTWIVNATVFLKKDGIVVETLSTSSAGRVTFQDVPFGTYTVDVDDDSHEYNAVTQDQLNAPFEIADNSIKTYRRGYRTGSITDDEGFGLIIPGGVMEGILGGNN